MAVEADVSVPASQIVGNAFVEQYYNFLHQATEEVHKFYQEVSVMSRPAPDGTVKSVTSLKAINDQILSFDYKNAQVQILTVDSQDSYKNGVIVLVTGFLTEKDSVRRKFSQSFFLAPQERGYFVMNDVLRYVDELDSELQPVDDTASEVHSTPDAEPASAVTKPVDVITEEVEVVNSTNVVTEPADAAITEPADAVKEPPVDTPSHPIPNGTSALAEITSNGKEPTQVTANENGNHTEKNAVQKVAIATENSSPPDTAATPEDAPKKSFASIVQSMAQKATPFNQRIAQVKPVQHRRAAPAPEAPAHTTAPAAHAPARTRKTVDSEGKSTSIFVGNLPMDATIAQLHETFSVYGSITPNGVQVRSYMIDKNCIGFVEFESASSVQNVLQAVESSPIRIGGRRISIEEKRGNSDNGKAPSGRSKHRNGNGYRRDGFKGRGNSSDTRRNDEKRASNGGRNEGEGSQKNYQNGGGEKNIAAVPVQ